MFVSNISTHAETIQFADIAAAQPSSAIAP
jgi:hypothetical protein